MSARATVLLAVWSALFVTTAHVSTRPFTAVDVNIDLSLARNHIALEDGWQVRPVERYRDLMNVFDRGQPARLTIPAVPATHSYLLRLKHKFHAMDQQLDISLNGTPVAHVRPTTTGHAEKITVLVPPGVITDARSRLVVINRGTPGHTEYEQVRLTNYRARLVKRFHVYLAVGQAREHTTPLVWGLHWLLAWGLAVLLWSVGISLMPSWPAAQRWCVEASFGLTAILWGALLMIPRLTPYRLACSPVGFWIMGFVLLASCCLATTFVRLTVRLTAALVRLGRRVYQQLVPGTLVAAHQALRGRAWRQAFPDAVAAACRFAGVALTRALQTTVMSVTVMRTPLRAVAEWGRGVQRRFPHVVACLRWGMARTSRYKVVILLTTIVVYGFLLRYNYHQSRMYEEWNYLGTTTDSVLMIDAAVRVLKSGTFAQFDGTYARVTGLAGYGLALLAIAMGGLYPGFQWLRLWLLVIGSLMPIAGFFVIRAAFGSAVGGLGTALLLAMEPILVMESRTIYHDVPATLCAAISLYCLYRVLSEERFRPRWAIALGVAAGLTILAKMSHLCLLAVILGSAILRRWTLPRWKNIGVALLASMLVLGVWMGRNARVLGMPILSSQSGIVFASSTGQAVWKPPGAGGEIATVGQEQRFNQAYVQQAMEWIAHHPKEYLRMAINKIATFWTHGPSPWQRQLLWALAASIGIALTWERRLLMALMPVAMYLVLYSITFGFTWPALPTYYPPFLCLLILTIAPLVIGTAGRLWQGARWLAKVAKCPRVLLDVVALIGCLRLLAPPLEAAWQDSRQYQRQAREGREYMAWVGTALPPNAVIVKTDRGNPWLAQHYTQRPVFFNVLYGIPWVIYKTPYTAQDYSRDWQSVSFNPTSFRFDLPRDHGPIDTAVYLPPEDLATFQRDGMHGFLSIWQQRGRELFVLDGDAAPFSEYLLLNAYALRGTELTLKFYRAFPESPKRALYRLVTHDDPQLARFGQHAEQVVMWKTASCPQQKRTTFWFEAAFGKQPGVAKILINGRYAMSFPLGATGNRRWTENGYQLEFTLRRPWWDIRPLSGTLYSVGTLALTVPARDITPGEPLTVSISPLLVTGDPESWFALLNKTGTLETLAQSGELPAASSDVQYVEGFSTLAASSEVLRSRDDGRAGRSATGEVDFWLARAQPQQM